MKEHIQSQLVNELKTIALRYHSHQSLRLMISESVQHHVELDREWQQLHNKEWNQNG